MTYFSFGNMNVESSVESLRSFIDQVNLFHPPIKFTAEYSKEEVNFFKHKTQ